MLIAGNWKMNLTPKEGVQLAEGLLAALPKEGATEVVVCPSFVSLVPIWASIASSRISLGAQDVFWEERGAFTGEISVEMLRSVGCSYCIIGHSERRGRLGKSEYPRSRLAYFSDSDEVVRLKLQSALAGGLTPILCVGETLDERDAGETHSVIEAQLNASAHGVDAPESPLYIAYEPVWAIGTGSVCDAEEASRVSLHIADVMRTYAPNADVRLLYGGSVNAENAAGLLSKAGINGALVGGASLKAKDFAAIVTAAEAIGE